MIYEFYCKKCNAIDEVTRPYKIATNPYKCPQCGDICTRMYTPPQIITKGEQILKFNPAFGKVMTDEQASQKAREQGLTSVGNENVEKHTASPKRIDYEENDYFL